jgi:uroporphyrinogen-III synthase
VIPVLGNTFRLPAFSSSKDDQESAAVQFGAIGPTTATFLREQLHFRVDVVSPKPNAEDLAAAIAEYDLSNVSHVNQMVH